jgi:AraC-like DNA-binding protein
MKHLFRIDSIADFSKLNGVETLHPLVSIIDYSKVDVTFTDHTHYFYGVYAVYLKEVICGELTYGRKKYDYQEGSLVFVSPGQVIKLVLDKSVTKRTGWALMFHPDLLHRTNLGKQINDYHFFSYDISEALHISEQERQIVLDCFSKIRFEIQQGVDKHSKKLITSNIELFLNYCDRFYDRQFITRENVNKGILEKFEEQLNGYFSSDKPHTIGLPTVAYFADELHLSANYFGDLIKKETGKSAKEYIQYYVMDLAKNIIFNKDKSINEIATELGFKYPQHFTRMFKNATGYAPHEYRDLN